MNKSKIEEGKVRFSECDCEFNIIGKQVQFCADLHKEHTVNFDCAATYNLLGQGLTQGVFQLQSPLGVQWCSKLKPESIEHLSALGAILRPGCMEAKDDVGISTTIHYERRKNKKEEIKPYHPVVDEALKETYQCLIYQEGAMEVARKCAGFTLQEADSLRKAIGKKLPEEMAKSKKLFLEKCKETKILSDKQAEEVFSWIEASQRYAFCKAHATSYGIIGYITAYIKCHFPLQFYCKWLSNEDKREEYRNLINEAKLFNINVYPPDLRDLRPDFYAKKGDIYFGLQNIKGIVKKDLDKIVEIISSSNLSLTNTTWLNFMHAVLDNVSSKTAEGLIQSGALDFFGLDRARMLYEYERFSRLTPVEKKALNEVELWTEATLADYVKYQVTSYQEDYDLKVAEYKQKLLQRETSGRTYKTELKEPNPNKRLEKLTETLRELESPLYSIQDTVDSIIFAEENLLGVALTKHKTDEIAIAAETATCLEVANGRKSYSVLKVRIDEVRAWGCKNGQSAGRNMCFLQISDKTSRISAVAFPDTVDEFQHLLTRGNLVFVSGEVQKDAFVVKRVYNVA